MRCVFVSRIIAAPPNLLSRAFTTSSAQRSEQTRVRVPCNSNGSIDLDVYYPDDGGRANTRTACIYLPRGPIRNHAEDDASNISALRSVLRCPVVTVNYRHGTEYKHPQPVFDVAAGYDWVVQNILNCSTGHRSNGKIAVCGELFGGSLATTLALTECRTDESASVVAAAINNAVFDWINIDKNPGGSARDGKSQTSRIDIMELCRQRTLLFRKLEDYFDPFASPILFFRAAGSKVPSPVVPLSEMEELAQDERKEFLESMRSHALPGGDAVHTVEAPADVEVTRRSSRRFPSKSLALRLPQFRIEAGADSLLGDQAAELSRLLLKAVDRQQKGRPSRGWDTARMDKATTEDMVEVEEVEGVGLWGRSTSGTSRMRSTAHWLNEALHG
ncbi:Putative alpha/beta hydrolase-3 [Septoria linicola]|uniref:Alpha/beta hydrolase-3 n=1 Tax=Septoria linicola TaxID=215465 RepID=A0A9Q9AIF7_9PEZI|nr:putative alpha/beta hydrolase-3 [Septoria linicola]USW47020.1 Putative alpha/beta hydrolase-3 [Septoria linicola]